MPDVKPEPGDLLVILRPAEGGGFAVLSPDIPGLVTGGATVPHALGMAADAAGELERAKHPPRPLREVFAELGAACGGDWDGVDPAKYVAEMRGEEPAGEWSVTPPKEPGYYWWREEFATSGLASLMEVYCARAQPQPHLLMVRGPAGFGGLASWGGEWWSVPIQPPGADS